MTTTEAPHPTRPPRQPALHPVIAAATAGMGYDPVMKQYTTEARGFNPEGKVLKLSASGARAALFLVQADAPVAGPNGGFKLTGSVLTYSCNPFTDPDASFSVELDIYSGEWHVRYGAPGGGTRLDGSLADTPAELGAASDRAWSMGEALPLDQRRPGV